MHYRVSTGATGKKANIHALIGPHAAGGIALSGHVDTVPVDVQAWSADPFTLRAHEAAAIEPAMTSVDPACGITLEVMDGIPGLGLPGEHALADLVKQLTGSNSTGYVSYGTEGGLYQQAGIPTIVWGPGAIAQAHQPDKWIDQAQFDACDAFICRLADRLSG